MPCFNTENVMSLYSDSKYGTMNALTRNRRSPHLSVQESKHIEHGVGDWNRTAATPQMDHRF